MLSACSLAFGRPHRNRTAFGLRVGDRRIPLLDARSATDLALHDRYLARGEVKLLTFVVHASMDATVVGPAWEQLQSGREADNPTAREAHERLRTCVCSMAHPETGEIVPACVPRSVLARRGNRIGETP